MTEKQKQIVDLGSRAINLVGYKFNRLTVLSFSHKNKLNVRFWKCQCICGKIVITRSTCLLRGRTQSCGCLRYERVRESHSVPYSTNTPEYQVWLSMKERCNNPKSRSYKSYGARGITVCDRWRYSFENFLEDVGKRPSDRHSIDRIDNNGDYEPANCRWATTKEQSNNKRQTVFITYKGTTKPRSIWAEELNIKPSTLRTRIKNGWDLDRAMKH